MRMSRTNEIMELLQKMKDKCVNPSCDAFPYYGMAPHKHDFSKTGNWVGSTIVMPEKDWPKNFTPSAESNNRQGVWYCPDCLAGQEEERESLTKGDSAK